MKVVFLTAGAAGMYCGSCMHDNALAGALRADGVDCVLQPVYTPIRTDAESVADENVFFGGIHIYLLQQFPWLRRVPAPLLRTLNWPPLIRWATARASSTDASKLGELSVSMLRGVNGRQADEVQRLVDWFANDMKPDAILFSNLLIGGAIPQIRSALPKAKLCVLLQGDDIFLDHLPETHRGEAIALCRKLLDHVDHVVTHSQFYADKMSDLMAIPTDKLKITPLSVDLSPFENTASDQVPEKDADSFRLGYLARIAPEKGFHCLVDSFLQLAPQNPKLSLAAAGWLGDSNRGYFDSQLQRIRNAGLESRFDYIGSPDLAGKVRFLRTLDLLCVPTEYADPKGLFVLEAIAAGVPVLQPDHGAFPELIRSTEGGMLFAAKDVTQLCEAIEKLIQGPELREQFVAAGGRNVRDKHGIKKAAAEMRQLLSE